MRGGFEARRKRAKQRRTKEREELDTQLEPIRELNASSMERTQRMIGEHRQHAQRQVADLIELLEESLVEHGNAHSVTCDKQTTAGAPCSCGFSSLLKARRLASLIEV